VQKLWTRLIQCIQKEKLDRKRKQWKPKLLHQRRKGTDQD
jgi:hypothetical protein